MTLQIHEMADNHMADPDDPIYEMTDNECYSSITAKRENAVDTGHQHDRAVEPAPSFSKCYRWTVALAILFNFLLIIAVAAVSFYYQTKMAEGFTEGLCTNFSRPPGTCAYIVNFKYQGYSKCSLPHL